MCGFAGCAMGHACQSPYFQQLGLRLMVHFDRCDIALHDGPRTYFGFQAAAVVLGITENEAEHLFDPAAYSHIVPLNHIKPKHVIARIEDFMRQQVAR